MLESLVSLLQGEDPDYAQEGEELEWQAAISKEIEEKATFKEKKGIRTKYSGALTKYQNKLAEFLKECVERDSTPSEAEISAYAVEFRNAYNKWFYATLLIDEIVPADEARTNPSQYGDEYIKPIKQKFELQSKELIDFIRGRDYDQRDDGMDGLEKEEEVQVATTSSGKGRIDADKKAEITKGRSKEVGGLLTGSTSPFLSRRSNVFRRPKAEGLFSKDAKGSSLFETTMHPAIAAGSVKGAEGMLQMFSQSLASQFNISTIVGKKFDGNPAEFQEFKLLWEKADQQMDSMGFTPSARFWELKKVLSGPAAVYVQGLPPGNDNSYEAALENLSMLYSEQKNTLQTLVRSLMAMPVCNGSFKDRQKLHSNIVAYKQGVAALGATSDEVLLAIELCIIEGRLDDAWKKDWFRYCARNKDLESPLGMTVTFKDLITKLHQSMIEQLRIKSASDLAPGSSKEKSSKEKSGATYAAVAGKKAPPPKQKGPKKQQEKEKAKSISCKLCLEDGKNKFKHDFPLGCPLVKAKSENRLSDEQIKEKVNSLKLCRNCFGEGHSSFKCTAPENIHCRVSKCGKRHHVAFHPGGSNEGSSKEKNEPEANNE